MCTIEIGYNVMIWECELISTNRRAKKLKIYLIIYPCNLYCINVNIDYIIETQKNDGKKS